MLPPVTTTASRESSEFEFVPGGGQPGQKNVPLSPSSSEPDSGLFGWVKGTGGGLLSRVAEKTKSSVETVITTLDPQMKEYIHSGGDVKIVVASDNKDKVSSIRQAFQEALGKATVYGQASQPLSVASQPVGFAAAKQAASERTENLKRNHPEATEEGVVIVAVESFLLEVGEDDWVDMGCILLTDQSRQIKLTGYTQATPVQPSIISVLKEETPEEYPKRWSGFAVTVGYAAEKTLNVPKERWHEAVCGLNRAHLMAVGAQSLANVYKKALLAKVEDV